jgi:hypothetical protein
MAFRDLQKGNLEELTLLNLGLHLGFMTHRQNWYWS